MTNRKTFYILSYTSIAVLLIAFLGFVYWLNQPTAGETPTAASLGIFAKAHVSELLAEQASPDTWTEGLRLGQQDIVITIDSGQYKKQSFRTINFLGAYGNVDLKEGSKIIVRMDLDDNKQPYVTGVVNHNRNSVVMGLVGLFVVLLVVLGGKKGVTALVGLVFTILSIWYFLIPMIQRGIPAIPATIFLVAVTTLVSLIALCGVSKKSFCAIVGCIGGVTMAGMIAVLAGMLTPITGFNMPEAEELVLRAGDTGLHIRGLLASGILIASLGAVMDVAMMIASALSEIHELNPKITTSQLFKSGINIGRDSMGTMANTLILAFAGASLNTLVLFRVFDYPYLQIFNSDLLVIEIIQGVVGSIGIILTVPLVAAISAYIYGHTKYQLSK